MRLITLLSCLFFFNSAQAYNWKRCKAYIRKPSKSSSRITPTSSIQEDLFYTNFGATTDATLDYTVGSMISVTSFAFSTGPCRAFGMAEQERLNYVASSQNELQVEVAEGHGEHLVALATVYGCNELGKSQFTNILRPQHSKIFSRHSIGNPEEINAQIFETVANSPVLSSNCDPEMI